LPRWCVGSGCGWEGEREKREREREREKKTHRLVFLTPFRLFHKERPKQHPLSRGNRGHGHGHAAWARKGSEERVPSFFLLSVLRGQVALDADAHLCVCTTTGKTKKTIAGFLNRDVGIRYIFCLALPLPSRGETRFSYHSSRSGFRCSMTRCHSLLAHPNRMKFSIVACSGCVLNETS
jgi:hypothetical protein